MNKKEFKQEFKNILEDMYKIMSAKNDDYSRGGAFENFELVEKLGITSVEKGILVRMCDKIGRISNLVDKDNKVKDEKITDTLQDLSVYSLILLIYLKNKKGE